MNIVKRQLDDNANLWKGVQKAKTNGDYYESDTEIKSLSLDEVSKRLKEIKSRNELGRKWPVLDEARWQRLAWRAKRLGFNNPFTLTKN